MRAAFAAAVALWSFGLASCASSSNADIPLAAGFAYRELQSLAERARSGDKKARLELGIRYEEGRGVEADSEKARRLYLSGLERPRFQTTYVPTGGGSVAPQNTAIGSLQNIWPLSFGEIRGYHPTRVATVLRLCGLEPRAGDEPHCRPEEATLLRHLVQFEANFKGCRIRSNLGNAGIHPAPFLFNAIDHERTLETRLCMLDGPVPVEFPRDQSRLIWTMWLALSRSARCGDSEKCGLDDVRRHFTNEMSTYREDSLMWFAMRQVLRRQPLREVQVGGSWWWALCGFMPEERRMVPADAETRICALAEKMLTPRR